MVAVIKTGHSIHRIFNYNENKVKEGVAVCIGAENYPVDVNRMNEKMKLNRLLKQAALNENVKRNSVHISLNFDPSEINLSKEKLVGIAGAYMKKIGFGEQPYLVYQHHDAGHPHLHIVSIKVRADGSRIDMNNIGRNESEIARQEIEKTFGLIPADSHQRKQTFELLPVAIKKVEYGKTELRRAIQNVLEHVLNRYNYTSLPELNAVLQLYNIKAERGSENSRVYQNKGLTYRVLDKAGEPIGVPIKASSFYNNPTLKFLEKQYSLNNTRRQPHKARVKNEIDRLFIGKIPTLGEWIKQLERKGIHVALRQNDAGLIYGITYVDHQTKCVFNGSALGKGYSAKAIQERCLEKGAVEQNQLSHSVQQENIGLQYRPAGGTETKAELNDQQAAPNTERTGNILDTLMQPEQMLDYIPRQLKKKSKKRRKKNNIAGNQ